MLLLVPSDDQKIEGNEVDTPILLFATTYIGNAIENSLKLVSIIYVARIVNHPDQQDNSNSNRPGETR